MATLIPLYDYSMYKKIPNTEIFLVTDDCRSLLFAPLNEEIYSIDDVSAREIFLASSIDEVADDELRDFLRDMVEKSPRPDVSREELITKTTKLSLIPNNVCNLRCSYCYSSAGRNQSVIEPDKLMAALDWYIDKQRVGDSSLSIFITGGGEPLATWPITSMAIAYASQRAEAQKIPLYTSVITNGTLITSEKIDFLKNYHCKIGVSFDVLEDLQNLNRGQYEKVCEALQMLRNSGMRVMINTTITPSSVDKMGEIIDEVIEKYAFVEQFTMEPVTAAGLFKSAGELRRFYDIFFISYMEASEKAKKAALNLRFTFDDALRGVTKRHCPGKFALTPSGKISVCHLVSSPMEGRFSDCIYGEVSDKGVNIDLLRFDELYHRNVFSYQECNDCIAKWSCGGECMTRRATYPRKYLEEVCRFNRRIVETLIVRTVY